MNIDGSIDPFYRYKRPIFKLILDEKHSKTIIQNISEISKSINRNPKMLEKYFSSKLSVATKLNKNTLEIKKILQLEILDNYFQQFIDKYVLCSVCNNPETDMTKSDNIILLCNACGNKTIIQILSKIDKNIFNTM